jgi:hypothetical protein
MPRSQGCRHRLASMATCSAGWVTLYSAPPATWRLGRLPQSRLWSGFPSRPWPWVICALCSDCNAFGICSSRYVHRRMALATEHPNQLHQRNGHAWFQGWRRSQHRRNADSRSFRHSGRRAQLYRARVCDRQPVSPGASNRHGHLVLPASPCCGWAKSSCRAAPSRCSSLSFRSLSCH